MWSELKLMFMSNCLNINNTSFVRSLYKSIQLLLIQFSKLSDFIHIQECEITNVLFIELILKLIDLDDLHNIINKKSNAFKI